MVGVSIRIEPVHGLERAAVVRLTGRFTPRSLAGSETRLTALREAGNTRIILKRQAPDPKPQPPGRQAGTTQQAHATVRTARRGVGGRLGIGASQGEAP